jgi:hypothetical protein
VIECQVCHQATAEWKIREFLGQDRERLVRWWYLCDVCLPEVFGPWVRKAPVIEEGQMWSSVTGKVYRKV